MQAGGRLAIATRRASHEELSQVNREDPYGSFVTITVADQGEGMDSQTRLRTHDMALRHCPSSREAWRLTCS